MKTENWLIIKLLKWTSGFFSDQKGNASRKAIALYISLFIFSQIVKGMLEGKEINETVVLYLVVVILFCLGAITAELIGKFPLFNNGKDKDEPAN